MEDKEKRIRGYVLATGGKIIKAYIVESIDVLPKKTHDLDVLLKQAKLDITELPLTNVKELSLAFTEHDTKT